LVEAVPLEGDWVPGASPAGGATAAEDDGAVARGTVSRGDGPVRASPVADRLAGEDGFGVVIGFAVAGIFAVADDFVVAAVRAVAEGFVAALMREAAVGASGRGGGVSVTGVSVDCAGGEAGVTLAEGASPEPVTPASVAAGLEALTSGPSIPEEPEAGASGVCAIPAVGTSGPDPE
jgi:hypothetical protein